MTIQAGVTFHFDLHVFDLRDPALAAFVLTFAELGSAGLGPDRGRATLLSVDQLDGFGEPLVRLYSQPALLGPAAEARPTVIPLCPAPSTVPALRIEFLSPTELKHAEGLATRPEFGVVFARIRDRIATLSTLYGSGSLDIDYKGLGERAERVRVTRCEVTSVHVERRSSRTGQRHSIGGFIGTADYEGDMAEFLPYLKAAMYSGVGRQTTFGNGQIRVDRILSAGR